MKMTSWRRRGAAAIAATAALGASLAHAVDYANIEVADNGVNPQTGLPTVTIPAGQATIAGANSEGFFLDSGAVVGEIPIRIGASAANDADGGVLLNYVRENGRTYLDLESTSEILLASSSTVRDGSYTSQATRNVAGGIALSSHRAEVSLVTSSITSGNGMNANLAAAYFPYSQSWVGGSVQNTVDNGALTQFSGSPGLALGTHVIPNDIAQGNHKVIIPGVEDTRRQGILFTVHAKNEGNMALVTPAADGSSYVVTTKGNATNGSDAATPGNNDEVDPFSFVYLPIGTPGITMASIHGGSGPNVQPDALIKSGSNFTIAWESTGTYRLSIAGQTPNSGVLLVNGFGATDGTTNIPVDNLVTYQADGNDWLITSRDLPGNGTQSGIRGLQDALQNQRIGYFSFAFLPFANGPTAPAANPMLNYTKNDVLAWNANVVEVSNAINDNVPPPGPPGMYIDNIVGTPGVRFYGHRENKGDNVITADGAFIQPSDGVMLVQVSQGLRDNTATGGGLDYGIAAGAPTGVGRAWEVATHTADVGAASASSVEMNVNYASALFGATTGFPMATNYASTSSGHWDLTIPGFNSQTDGVLMSNGHGNVDNYTTVTASVDGSFDVDMWDNNTSRENGAINYVFLPYASENLVAGQVGADGTVISSTGVGASPGEFTLTKEAGAGSYLLTIAGKTPSTGMLLLNGAENAGVFDNTLVYEPAGDSFRITGIDLITFAEKSGGSFVQPEDTPFSFAYIDYAAPPVMPSTGGFLDADFDEDGAVDGDDLGIWKGAFGTTASGDADGDGDSDGGDFLVWQRQVGQTPAIGATGAVPEPGSVALTAIGLMAVAASRRRK